MKKLCLVLLALLLLVQSFPVLAAEDTKVMAVEYFFDEDFDTSPLGGEPEKGTCNSSGNKLCVTELDSREGRVLKYETTGASGYYYQHSVSPKNGHIIMEFDMMYEDVGFGNGTMRLCFKDSVNTEILIANINPNRELVLPSGEAVANLTPGKFYSFCIDIDMESYTADIYINQRKRASNAALSQGFKGVKTIRYHLFMLKEGEYPNFYFDNIRAYGAEEPIFKYEKRTGLKADDGSDQISASAIALDEDVEKYMADTVALYAGKNKIAIDGTPQYLDPSNKDVSVFIESGRSYVPVRFVSEALGYSVKWDDASRTATISDGETTVTLVDGSYDINVNGKNSKMDSAPLLRDGRMFIPVRAVCEAFGKKLTYDKCGLIVIADRENFFNFRDDIGIFRSLSGKLAFEDVKGSEMVQTLKENFEGNEHPRLYITKTSLEKIKSDIGTNEYMKQWASSVCASADNLCKKDVLKYELRDGTRLLAVSRDAKSYIETLSFAYLISEDSKYADRAIKELMNLCSFPDWHPRHFLDTAEMMQAVAVGYDWLYDVLTPEQKATIRNALVKFGLEEIMKDYTNDPARERGNKWSLLATPDNWNLVCNGSAIIAAFAIADEEEVLASSVIDAGMKDIRDAILMYAPDGAWFEGPGYWQYATSYYVNLMACLKSVYGHTFGYMDTPGVADTGYYINALSSKSGVFNFHDSSVSRVNAPEQFFLAENSNDGGLAELRINQMNEGKLNGTVRDLIFYNPDFAGAKLNMPLDYYYRDTEVVTMRSNWTENSSIYVGLHSGKVGVTHGQMDMGEFVIDGYDTRYATALGAESYNLGVSTWDLYRNRAEGHNTIVLNPSDDGGQKTSGAGVFEKFESNSGSVMAITDMTSAYDNMADRVVRGMKLTNNRSNIIIQDEIKTKAPSDFYWFLHSECDISVAEDGKSALIKGKFKDLYVYLLEDVPGTFSLMEAQPFEASPVVPNQNKNLTFKKLTFHAENVTDMTLAIGMEFIFPGEDTKNVYRPTVVPLESWKLDESKATAKPRLTDLKVNGESIENFDPETLNYTYRMKYDDPDPVITAEGDGNVEVINPEDFPGFVFVKIKSTDDEQVYETYAIKVIQEVLSEAPPGLRTMSIASVVASSVPQPENSAENSIDGNLDTRWSAKGNSDIVFDLGEIQKVSHLGIAVYQDRLDGRKQFFEIHVSNDGENYTRVYSGESSGTTIEKEIFPITPSDCRYVKIECNGTNIGEWNSITEVSVFGP